jgi:hypothetical protein
VDGSADIADIGGVGAFDQEKEATLVSCPQLEEGVELASRRSEALCR